MKKKIRIFMMALTLCSMLFGFTTTVNAADISTTAVCIQHGPWSYYCGGETATSTSHTFTYQGYLKSCSYKSWSAITMMKCTFASCGYYTGAGSHSHGVSGHTCGQTNNTYCNY